MIEVGVTILLYLKCSHIIKQNIAPDWDSLAHQYSTSSSVLIGSVDCTAVKSKELCEDFKVQGYPTLKCKLFLVIESDIRKPFYFSPVVSWPTWQFTLALIWSQTLRWDVLFESQFDNHVCNTLISFTSCHRRTEINQAKTTKDQEICQSWLNL